MAELAWWNETLHGCSFNTETKETRRETQLTRPLATEATTQFTVVDASISCILYTVQCLQTWLYCTFNKYKLMECLEETYKEDQEKKLIGKHIFLEKKY